MSKSKVTPVGRCSFPHLDKPGEYNKYSVTILLPKTGKDVPEFVAWLKQSAQEEASAVAGNKAKEALALFTNFRDGDDTTAFKTWRDQYKGHWVLSCSRKAEHGKPTVVNRMRKPIDASEVYAGCDILLFIDVFGYSFGNKKSVSISFQHVMKVAENTPFAGGVGAEDAFKDIDLPEEKTDDLVNPFAGL